MQLRQFIPGLFCGPRIEKPNRNSRELVVAIPLARWVRVKPRPRSAFGFTPLGKGVASPPVASPGPGGPSCPPWTSRPWETSLSPRTPIDQAYAAMDPHEGSAPIDRSGASAPLPHGQPWADWMRP